MDRGEDTVVLLKLDHGDDKVVLDAASGGPANIRDGESAERSRPAAQSLVEQTVPTPTAAVTAHSVMARSVEARAMTAHSTRGPSATARSAHAPATRSTAGASSVREGSSTCTAAGAHSATSVEAHSVDMGSLIRKKM